VDSVGEPPTFSGQLLQVLGWRCHQRLPHLEKTVDPIPKAFWCRRGWP
jgi:hypothetical protein